VKSRLSVALLTLGVLAGGSAAYIIKTRRPAVARGTEKHPLEVAPMGSDITTAHGPNVLADDSTRADPCARELAEIRELQSQIRQAARAASTLPRQGGESGGLAARCTPVPWPLDLPDQYREDVLQSALVNVSGRSFDLDCSEFPCLIITEGPPENTQEFDAILGASTYGDAALIQHGFGVHGNQYRFISILPKTLADERISLRVQERIDAHARELSGEAEVPEETAGSPQAP